MNCTDLLRLVITMALVALFLAGCAVATSTEMPTSTPICVKLPGDCSVRIPVGAWIDANANGTRDAGELPFPGVRFEPAEGQYGRGSVTDESGVAWVDFYYAGAFPVPCDSPQDPCALGWTEVSGHLLVEPEIPSGYGLTTPSGLRATDFGFAPLDPTETPVPLAAKPASETPEVEDARRCRIEALR